MIILGGHVSAAGGALKAIQRAQELQFAALQIHPTAPQRWSKPTTDAATAAEFAALLKPAGIQAAFFHNIYLINLASELPSLWHGSQEITKHYLVLAAQMGVRGVITHLGSHRGAGWEAVRDRVVTGLRSILDAVPPTASFIIENTAGAGGTLGRSLEEIEQVLEGILPHHDNVAVCIDTCHAFSAGIPIHTREGLDAFLAEFNRRISLSRLACIHLNDSKFPFASNRDRHENIGDGYFSTEGFRHLFHHPLVQELPFVLEVPGLEKKGPDAANRDRVLALAAP
jgi:deoxyribonuclease-4